MITTLITTFNRRALCLRLLKSYAKEVKRSTAHDGEQHRLILIDDCSDPNYVFDLQCALDKHLPGHEATIITCRQNYGKANYWQLLNVLYAELQSQGHTDYIVQLPDDVTLTPRFFAKAKAKLDAIVEFTGPQAGGKVACLNLYRCYRDAQWGSGDPQPFIFGRHEVRLTGWVDMCFIAYPRMMEFLNYQLDPIDRLWRMNPDLGSGVGAQISRRLRSRRLTMWQAETSLVIDHGTQPSQMNPKRPYALRTA